MLHLQNFPGKHAPGPLYMPEPSELVLSRLAGPTFTFFRRPRLELALG